MLRSLLKTSCLSTVNLACCLLGFHTSVMLLPSHAGEDAPTVSAVNPALHRKIDRLIEESAVGPMAAICSDSDFVRRIYLDLTGIIPGVEEVRAFLDDPAPDKRVALIDSLLESPAFDRHFAVQLDVLLLERRIDKHIEASAWERFLINAVAGRKPLDQLFRELVYPDELDGDDLAAAKFLLNREAEPHAMTRDIGRLFFGMDMQCAQCHDHPLVDDYLQEDYYGLHAFLSRTKLFVDPQSKLGMLAEQADGEVQFESVFTGEGRTGMPPRLPRGGSAHTEPSFPEEDAYRIKPEKTQAGKPRFSRRRALSEMLVENRQFRRNLANRLWALIMGRGAVHPADFDSLQNPSTYPQLLSLLADDWATHDFDLRYAVRELVLTKTYQRSCEPPPADSINFVDLVARRASLSQAREAQSADLATRKSEGSMAEQAWREAVHINDQLHARLPELQKQLAETHNALQEAASARQQSKTILDQVERRSVPIQNVREIAAAASESLADEVSLTEVVAILEKRVQELDAKRDAARSELQEQTEIEQQIQRTTNTLTAEIEALTDRRVPAEQLAELERAHVAAVERWTDADAALRMLDANLEICGQLLEFRDLVDQDPARAETHWQSIVERWTVKGQIAPLKPLTPEQLTTSIIQATGFLSKQRAAAEATVDASPPKTLVDEEPSERTRTFVRTVDLEQAWLNQIRGSVQQFVAQYGGLPGEEFQATVNQALFLGNSPIVEGWLVPSSGSLVGRLTEIEPIVELADELTLAVLSRAATREEQLQIDAYLAARLTEDTARLTEDTERLTEDTARLIEDTERLTEDKGAERSAAIAELVWALISSAEFRFNH